MTASGRYLDTAITLLAALRDGQAEAIEVAADAVATAVADQHRVWVAATSHVLHTELYLRAGGLAAVHPLGETPNLAQPMLAASTATLGSDGPFAPQPGDVVLVGTNAGTDAGTVEVALRASAAGCTVIALTSVNYETYPDVVREHPSRRTLIDIADIVVDIGGVVGDAVIELERVDTAVGPTSGVTLVAAAWAILVRAAERLVERGLVPIVYRSVQIPGAEALFRERRAAYLADGRGARSPADAGTGNISSTRTGRRRRSDS